MHNQSGKGMSAYGCSIKNFAKHANPKQTSQSISCMHWTVFSQKLISNVLILFSQNLALLGNRVIAEVMGEYDMVPKLGEHSFEDIWGQRHAHGDNTTRRCWQGSGTPLWEWKTSISQVLPKMVRKPPCPELPGDMESSLPLSSHKVVSCPHISRCQDHDTKNSCCLLNPASLWDNDIVASGNEHYWWIPEQHSFPRHKSC